MSKPPIALPPCGMFVGTGIYPSGKDYLLCVMHGHMAWQPQTDHPLEMIDKIIADNQGNTAQFWGTARGSAPAVIAEWIYALDEIGIKVPDPDWEKGRNLQVSKCREIAEHPDRLGAGALRFAKAAAEKGIYTTFIYVNAGPEWSMQLKDLGPYYLGYDFGERHSFGMRGPRMAATPPDQITLQVLAENLVDIVREHVEQRRATGWGPIMATSSSFHIDYEVVAGTDIPVIEDFAFCHLSMSSALARGLYRQYDLPMWGSHLAHEHYSWMPNSDPHKFDLFRASMYLKYMAGSKMIINESGGWFVEASLCEDSPKHAFPRVPLEASDVAWNGEKDPMVFAPYIPEARKRYGTISYDSPVCRRYRKEISDFYDYVKANGTPAGQPESTIAIAKGNLDLSHHRYMPNAVVGGARAQADVAAQWFEGPPERGWEIVRKVFYPLLPILAPYPNHFLSGSPHGMVDIVSFAFDKISAEFLSSNYKALLFSGWNTASDKQYDLLTTYVRNGGTLFISIPHLSTNVRRNYMSYAVDELVNGGDFSELCGVRVLKRGSSFYWATAPHGSSELGFTFPRRFGIMGTPMGDIEVTDPNAVVLVVEDEQKRPLLLRRKCGKGEVYFLNSWAYPGALDIDDGPGATTASKGLIGDVYRHIAMRSRGNVWITDNGDAPGVECEYVSYSYFPEAGTICLLNVDFDRPHSFSLHHFGYAEPIALAPGEFRTIQTTKPGGAGAK